MLTQSTSLKVNVSVSNLGLSNLDKFIDDIKAVGMNVEEIFREIGIISGSIEAGKISMLQNVDELTAIEVGSGYNVANF